MELTLQDFFNANPITEDLGELGGESQSIYVDTAKAFARNFYQPIYLVDFYTRKVIYISGNMRYLCEGLANGAHGESNAIYYDSIPEEERDMLKEIAVKTFDQLYSIPAEERKDWNLSFSVHLQRHNRKRLLLHRAAPLKLTPEGKVWLVMCTFSLTSEKKAGSPILRCYGHRDYFFYSLERHVWYYREGFSLTDMERDVLLYSSQGYTMKEIASRICKSEDSVKSYKRQLFAKLGVKNITEAVCSAVNNNLLQ